MMMVVGGLRAQPHHPYSFSVSVFYRLQFSANMTATLNLSYTRQRGPFEGL